ncbi:MAG TPA: plastocyanin/azurin family copper-binding protein [Vicinamibacterales bacterium]
MKRICASVLATLFAFVTLTAALSADPAARTIAIKAGDDMKFSVTKIVAKPGERLRIVLTSRGTMPKIAMAHNVVVLAKGTDADAFVNASAVARTTDYIAPSMKSKVIAATKLAGNGETVEVTFDVPKAAGNYDFVCSFPGHYLGGMRGVLTVK